MPTTKISRLSLNPARKFRDLGMLSQSVDGIELTLEFLFRKHFVNLRVTGPANADHLLH